MKKIGVLALQGAFAEHIKMIELLGHEGAEVKTKADLKAIDGIILPGGESTAIGKLLNEFKLKAELESRLKEGLPVWGTCAGMIILSEKIEGSDITHIPLMNIEVVRNGYGRQLGSFKADGIIEGVNGGQFPLIFIRAPYIRKTGDNVKILCKVENRIVAARQENMLVTSFHPELTDDLRMHRYFLNMIDKKI